MGASASHPGVVGLGAEILRLHHFFNLPRKLIIRGTQTLEFEAWDGSSVDALQARL